MANSLKLYVDPNNANPSRLSRLPNAMRFDSRQELYALNIGAKSWQDFEANITANKNQAMTCMILKIRLTRLTLLKR